jgi:hypothetical protein
MKTKTIKVYICEYCKKLYQIKHFAEYHEKICKNNPNNFRDCHSCMHLEKKEHILYDYYTNHYGDSDNRTLNLLYCDEIKSYLYPVSVEIKGNYIDLVTEPNVPMKKECSIFRNYKSGL